MAAYNILEARNKLSQIVHSVESGAEVTIMRRGVPVAKVVPVDPVDSAPAPPRRGWTGQQIVEWLEANPLPPESRRSAEQIEADIREMRESWD